jgi:hypothetical protein
MEFKALVFDLRHHEKTHSAAPNSSRYDLKTPSTAASDSFRNLVQKQRLASSVVRLFSPLCVICVLCFHHCVQVLDDVCDSTVISSVDQLPSVRRLKGKIVPSPFVKDAMVSVVNKDGRKPKGKALHPLGEFIVECIVGVFDLSCYCCDSDADKSTASLRFDDSTFNEGSSLLYGVGFNSVASDSVSALSGGTWW